MSRTAVLKLAYAGFLVGALLVALLVVTRLPLPWAVGAALLLLVPGRVQGLLLRDVFRGRRHLDAGRHDEAAACFARAVDTLTRHPWRRHALWLGFSIYTVDARAMAYNGLGAVRVRLGDLQGAREALERAIRLDPRYPLAHFNLAMVALGEGDADEARRHFHRARELGYDGGPLDQLALSVQGMLAAVEGR